MDVLFKDECYLIQGAVFEVYNKLGNGFLEAVYQEALEHELAFREIPFVAQPELKIHYKGVCLKQTYQPDIICFNKIILELKSLKELAAEHEAQLLNYLKATGIRIGLLINFGSRSKVQIRRMIL